MNELEHSNGAFIFYQSDAGQVKIQVMIGGDQETLWVSQKGMAEIF